MSRLTTGDRKELPDHDFAYIDKQGGRHLPIENASHVRDAISRWPLTQFESSDAKEKARKRIMEAAKKLGIEVSSTDRIVRDDHHPPSTRH